MKKHFLLALMTLLPFMGAWAGNVGTFAELKDALAAGGEVTLTADMAKRLLLLMVSKSRL